MKQSKTKLLHEAFNFSPHDLQANQDGVLSTEQRQRLDREIRGSNWRLLISGILTIIAGGLGAILFYEMGDSLIATVIFLGIAVAGLVLMAIRFGQNRQLRAKVEADAIEHVTGQIELTMGGRYRQEYFTLKIQDKSFSISRQQHLALSNHTRYKIYFLRDSYEILSIDTFKGSKKSDYFD